MLEVDSQAAATERDSEEEDYGLTSSKDASPSGAPPLPPPRLSPEALQHLSERESEFWGETTKATTPRQMQEEDAYRYWGEAMATATTVGGGGSGGARQYGSMATGDYRHWGDATNSSYDGGRGGPDADAWGRVRGSEGMGRDERWTMRGRETLDSDISEIVSHGVVPEQRHHTPRAWSDELALC